MSIREELILKVLSKEESVVDLANEDGVSRKTIYKWLARYYTVGLEFREPEVRVWFFDVLLGEFDPRTQQSVEPIAPPSERK